MPKRSEQNPAEYIVPLYMNKLQGRMLYLPGIRPNAKEILVVYDHLGSLEEWWDFVKILNRFGAVTKTDLPGFGGMESFYKIYERPTVDRLADYLAAFIKLRYKRKQLSIIGIGFGFVIVTRMLQRYPEITKKVELVVSVNGYSHKDDFQFSPLKRYFYRIGGWVGSQRVPAPSLQLMGLRAFVLRSYYLSWPHIRKLVLAMDQTTREKFLSQRIMAWQKLNLRTHLANVSESMKLDNCKKQINVPLWHISLSSDDRFNHHVVEQHMRIIYKDYHQSSAHIPFGRFTLLDNKDAIKLFPTRLRKILAR